MSGIAGIYYRDGRHVDPALLGRVTASLSPWGPDGTSSWACGNVALAYGAFHTTPESCSEEQPLADASGTFRLAFDGRIDNGGEIRRELLDKGLVPRTDTDAELVLLAYRAWGQSCAAHLLGDFAFALWDSSKRCLYCARDILGCRPFYYHQNEKKFVFASEVAQVLDASEADTTPNEGAIAEFLAVDVTSRDETLYQNVQRLPPAHYLVVTSEGVRCERYWDVDVSREIRYQDESEYSAHLFELLQDAVRCRLRANGPVGAELSGGVDSSCVVGMVQHLVREGTVADQGFETFSWVFPGMRCDESDYIEQVVRLWNLRANTVSPEVDAHAFADQIRESRYLTTDAIGLYADVRKKQQHERGFRVILTGMGGDDWLSGADNPYPDLIRNRKVTELAAEVWRQRYAPGSIRLLVKSAAEHSKILTWLLEARRARRGATPWIAADFSRRTRLRERSARVADMRELPSSALRERYWFLNNGWLPLGCEMSSWSSARHQIDQRHPLFDRRIIEFAFAIPECCRRRGGQQKYLLRQAVKDLLPEQIRHRRTKADFSHFMWQSLDQLGGASLFAKMVIADRGFVQASRLGRMCQDGLSDYRSGGQPSGGWILWSAYALDVWLSELAGNAARRITS